MYNEVLDNLKTKAQYKGTYSKINPELVMTEIDKNASPDAIFTVDTGMNCIWTARYINATQKRNILFSANHGSMANALPQAIGAAFACPEREIIAVCGDGGLSMCLGDIETIVQYNLPIKIFVLNNRALGMVKLEMEVAGLPDWQTNMVNPDFEEIARVAGFKNYFKIDDPENVSLIIEKSLSMDAPV